MAEQLTREQLQAVENRGGKLLVSAAAGSGKTKVLVDRIMGYILDPVDPANIDDFLIITYTKAAAAELQGKIAAKLSELISANSLNKHLHQQMQRLYLAKISTVHGFCSDILRQYAYRLDVSADFRVADEGECLQLQVKALEQVLNATYESANENPDFCAFVDSQGFGRDDKQISEIILKVYNSARCHLNPEQWLDWCVSSEFEGVTDAGETPWGAYQIEDLKTYLAMQIETLKRCVSAGMKVQGMEKSVALFEDTVAQLQTLYNSKTWDEIICNQTVDYGRLTFPKNCSDLQLAEKMKAARNACKEGLAKRLRNFTNESAQVLEDVLLSSSAARGLVALVHAFSVCYDRLKKNRGILDFGDLEHKTLDLLLGKQRTGLTAIAVEIGDRFREVVVDEYQDSNEIQDAIFGALTQKRQNCFMVGDVKQSIYQFRLADPSIFIKKYNEYAPVECAKAGEGRKVLLSSNFRSSQGIISAVNDVFGGCMSPAVGGLVYGEDEMLREGIPHISLNEPEVSLYGIDVVNDTYDEEATFVANKICELLDGTHTIREKNELRPISPKDIVILLRSPGSVGSVFQYALQERGVQCVTGDTANLLQTEEITTIRAILHIINNPLQDIPLVAVLTSAVFGYTADDLAKLRSSDRNADIYKLLTMAKDEKSVAFLQILNKLRASARLLSVTQLLTEIYQQTNLLSVYSAMPNGGARLDNLQAFFQIASEYEGAGLRGLSRFLEFLDSAEERGLVSSYSNQENNAVTIMSIHKSKGLEFPVVFLSGLSRSFNMESANNQVLCDKDLGLGLGCVNTKLRVRYPTIAKRAIRAKIQHESISEELRVLYVAMTRAKDRLVMTYATKNLSKALQEVAMRLDMSSRELLASEANCPGEWILQSALTRTEAGAFFALSGHPDCAQIKDNPWLINVAQVEDNYAAVPVDETVNSECTKGIIQRLVKGIGFTYSNNGATVTPSKLTATQLKGRDLDTEIADGTTEKKSTDFRKPGSSVRHSGISYGNAIHVVLQYIDFSACNSCDGIRNEVKRITEEKLISSEQAEMVDCQLILAFFDTPIGRKLKSSKYVIREFKFSILDSAEKYYPNVTGEQILLQGVVDCAIIEDDGITILDFKTDNVTEESLPSLAEKYKPQVLAYCQALSRIYQKPIKSSLLYFFGLNRAVDVN